MSEHICELNTEEIASVGGGDEQEELCLLAFEAAGGMVGGEFGGPIGALAGTLAGHAAGRRVCK